MCGGNKGNQVSTTQSQQYTPNAPIGSAINQAITGAESAASTPFQQPVAPVAGFTPFQTQAFNQVQGTQGMAQPYFDAGQAYLQNSAAPISASDVNQYYNPMAANVTGQLENIFGQQQRNTTGQLTQAAGGVGADRIAVGQSELANQQGLAAGQTYAGLYQQALQAAQQNKQMQAGAGYGIAQFGPAAQNASLQGTTALGQAGSQQQGLTQAQLSAGYQNELAKIAYPFQTPQYLAGITAGLAPAAGGTTQGQSTTTYPTPSPLAQALGIGTAGAGLIGGFGGFGGSGGLGMKGSYGGSSMLQPQLAGLDPSARFASGGAVPSYGMLAEKIGANWGMNPYQMPESFADGGDIGEGGMSPLNIKGLPFPGAGQIPAGVVPTISLPAGGGQGTGGHLSLAHQSRTMPGGGSPETTGGDIAQAMKMATLMGGMARGGTAYPRHFATGGGDDDEFDSPGSAFSDFMVGTPETRQRALDASFPPQSAIYQSLAAKNRAAQAANIPFTGPEQPQMAQADISGPSNRQPGNGPYQFPGMIALPKDASRVAAGNPAGLTPDAQPYPKWEGPQQPGGFNPQESDVAADSGPTGPRGSRGRQNADMSPEQYFMPKSQQPYPDALKRDWGQNLTRSPWMSLVKAGAEMASSTGPIGSVIGKGIKAGAGELDSQRKELRSEEDHNQKADALWQRAKIELDKYQRKTPHELATEGFRAQSLALGKYQAVNYTGEDGKTAVGVFDAKRGIVIDPVTRQQVNATNIQRRTTSPGANHSEADIGRIVGQMDRDTSGKFAGMTLDQKREIARQMLGQTAGPAAPAAQGSGSSPTTAVPDPGEGKREPGKWYIGPSGKPQQWQG